MTTTPKMPIKPPSTHRGRPRAPDTPTWLIRDLSEKMATSNPPTARMLPKTYPVSTLDCFTAHPRYYVAPTPKSSLAITQTIVVRTPPSARSAAPFVADESGLAT